MMQTLPPLTKLRVFEAAGRHMSFKLAAAELGVTPTAVSHQIRLLEQFCGQPLFRRRPRPLALTWAGEQLFPIIRDGLETFGETLSAVRAAGASGRLRITTTNAFAARWLLPRLPRWREAHPRLKLDIVGTDAVLDLKGGEADIAIRYAAKAPSFGVVTELLRDRFHIVASPNLVDPAGRLLRPAELARLPLIEAEWPPTDPNAPSWRQWQGVVSERDKTVPNLAALVSLTFREELHAIQAAIAGQGVAICSDVLIEPELASGVLVALSKITLPGYGFYLIYRDGHPKLASIVAFLSWIRTETAALR